MVDEILRGGDGTPVEGGDPAREGVDEAVQFGVWKCPVDVSVSFRGVAVEIVRAENDFERPTAPDQMWKTFRPAAAGMQSHPDFGLAESRVLATRPTRRDRKSTRLNSSHQIISYAVFCLKKKKNKHTVPARILKRV